MCRGFHRDYEKLIGKKDRFLLRQSLVASPIRNIFGINQKKKFYCIAALLCTAMNAADSFLDFLPVYQKAERVILKHLSSDRALVRTIYRPDPHIHEEYRDIRRGPIREIIQVVW